MKAWILLDQMKNKPKKQLHGSFETYNFFV